MRNKKKWDVPTRQHRIWHRECAACARHIFSRPGSSFTTVAKATQMGIYAFLCLQHFDLRDNPQWSTPAGSLLITPPLKTPYKQNTHVQNFCSSGWPHTFLLHLCPIFSYFLVEPKRKTRRAIGRLLAQFSSDHVVLSRRKERAHKNRLCQLSHVVFPFRPLISKLETER